MSESAELLAALFCFGFALFYLLVQVLRLLFPVWAWRFERDCDQARAVLAAGQTDLTARRIAHLVPSQACFARLIKADNLTLEERPYKRKLLQKMFLAAAVTAFLYYVRFEPNLPEVADSFVTDMLIIALGMVFSALADYRIFRARRLVTDAVQTQNTDQ